jgi:hypothetical protein
VARAGHDEPVVLVTQDEGWLNARRVRIPDPLERLFRKDLSGYSDALEHVGPDGRSEEMGGLGEGSENSSDVPSGGATTGGCRSASACERFERYFV